MATIKFYLDHPKEKGTGQLKKTEVPIRLRVSLDRLNRFELSTKERIIPRFWDAKKQEAKANYNGHVEINLSLAGIKNDLVQLWRDNKSLSKEDLRELALPIVKYGQAEAPVEKKSLLCILRLFIEQYNREKNEKTVAKYESLELKLKEFIGAGKLYLENIDVNFFDKFKQFLYDYPNPKYKGKSLHLHPSGDYWVIQDNTDGEPIGLFDNTVMKYFINLKTFCQWAEKRQYTVNSSYKSWEIIRRKKPKPVRLKLSELQKLQSLRVDPNIWDSKRKTPKRKKWAVTWGMRKAQAAMNARDYLLLECFTGQRISDLKRFHLRDFNDNRWTFFPRKGNRLSEKKITVYFTGFCAPALDILQRHNFQLPKISEQKLNKSIKTVCQLAGIDEEISVFRWSQNKMIEIRGPKYKFVSTHTGRKTFITIGLQFMPAKVVKDLAGIDSWETLKHYEDEADQEIIEMHLNTAFNNMTLMRKAQ